MSFLSETFYFFFFQYCVYGPSKYNSDEIEYEQMLVEKNVSQIINRNIFHYHPDSMDIQIKELYNRTSLESIGFVLVM